MFAAATGYFGADGRTAGGRLPTFALKPRLTASGVVVDEAGRPVAGAALKASPLPGSGPLRNLAIYQSGGFARSAATGRFQLSKLAPGVAYDLRIDRDGYAPARLELPARAAGSPAAETRIVLHAGRTAFGKVTDGRRPPGGRGHGEPPGRRADEPLGRGCGRLRDPERYAGSPTDAAGRFELRDLPAGTFDLLVRAHGYAPLTVPSLVGAGGEGDDRPRHGGAGAGRRGPRPGGGSQGRADRRRRGARARRRSRRGCAVSEVARQWAGRRRDGRGRLVPPRRPLPRRIGRPRRSPIRATAPALARVSRCRRRRRSASCSSRPAGGGAHRRRGRQSRSPAPPSS